jgi:hypothetical protein
LNALKFDSFFESGNLCKAYLVSGRSTDLTTITATTSSGGLSTENVDYLNRLKPVDQEYDLYLRTDTHTAGNIQWFYFSATPPSTATFPLSVRINIVNLMKRGSLYEYGMRPLVYETSNEKWVRGGEEVRSCKERGDSVVHQLVNFFIPIATQLMPGSLIRRRLRTLETS